MAEAVKTETIERLQPWQALFGILTYIIGAFNISDVNVLILIGLVLVTLGFVQRSTYKHKEAVKEVVAPWVLEKLMKILEEYLPEEPEPEPDPLVLEIEALRAQIAEMEATEVIEDG